MAKERLKTFGKKAREREKERIGPTKLVHRACVLVRERQPMAGRERERESAHMHISFHAQFLASNKEPKRRPLIYSLSK